MLVYMVNELIMLPLKSCYKSELADLVDVVVCPLINGSRRFAEFPAGWCCKSQLDIETFTMTR